METIAERLNFYRKNKGLTYKNISDKLGLSEGAIRIAIKRNNVKLSHINEICENFDISKEWVLNGVGEMISKKNELIQFSNDEIETLTNKNGVKFFIYDDESVEIEVCILPFEAYASSNIENYFDLKYTDTELRKVKFRVDKIGKGVYFGFKTKNNSMNGGGIYDTPNGAEVLGRELGRHLWDKIHKNDYGFILMTENAILHKDILGYNSDTGMLKLHSRNPSEEDFEISINTVYRIFTVIKRTF